MSSLPVVTIGDADRFAIVNVVWIGLLRFRIMSKIIGVRDGFYSVILGTCYEAFKYSDRDLINISSV